MYHIINRGNYRQDLLINESAHQLFETCLFEVCKKCRWILECQYYVNLYPVHAGICSGKARKDYRWSSFWYLYQTYKHHSYSDLSGTLEHAGGLKKASAGHRKFMEYSDLAQLKCIRAKAIGF